jgi:L-galactose dehydrogenase
MIHKQLGQTGLSVSTLGFGAAPLGNEYGQIDPREGMRAVHHAIERGINYFDVAPYYGRTLAETRFGQALVGYRDQVILATKVGRYGDDPETGFDFSAKGVSESVEASLSRLKTDYIDVLQAHDIEFGLKEQIINETLPAMQQLKQAGKIRFVGITAYPLYMLKEVIEAAEVDVVLSYSRYHLFDTTLDDILTPTARKKRVGLINASPLNMGLLTDQDPPDWHPAAQQVRAVVRQVARHCRSQGTNIVEVALQFALAHPDVATTLVGMSTVAQVDQNIRAMETSPDPELMAELLKMIEPVANIYWQEGRPENYDPGAVEQKSSSV